jgi:hypothetical protein
VELVHWALKKKGGQSVLKRMKVMFLGVNGFLYAFLLVLVIIFIALEASISSTDVRSLPSMMGKPSAIRPSLTQRSTPFSPADVVLVSLFLGPVRPQQRDEGRTHRPRHLLPIGHHRRSPCPRHRLCRYCLDSRLARLLASVWA